jgi:hypothetical protein
VSECCWCLTRDAVREIAGHPFCEKCYPAGKAAVYETGDLEAQIKSHAAAARVAKAETRTRRPVEQATAAPGEKRKTSRKS